MAVEDAICKIDEDDKEGDENLPTPMVLVVVAGGPGTLQTIIATLKKKRPVVVLADSGGAAEAIFKYIHYGEMPQLSTKLNKEGVPVNQAAVRASPPPPLTSSLRSTLPPPHLLHLASYP